MIVITAEEYIERRAYVMLILSTETDTQRAMDRIASYDIKHFYTDTNSFLAAVDDIPF